MTTKEQLENLHEIGKGAFEAVEEMVSALNCDYDRLEELRDELGDLEESAKDPTCSASEQNDAKVAIEEWKEMYNEELESLINAAGGSESRDDAYERITEDPLSIEYRSGWSVDKNDLQAEEVCILLATGGPAVRILADLDDDGTASRPRLETQDWYTPWTEYLTTGSSNQVLLDYVNCLCQYS